MPFMTLLPRVGIAAVVAALLGGMVCGGRIKPAGGKAFAAFMVSPRAQRAIDFFGAEKFGPPLFFPAGGKSEKELEG